jgi:hypothetical protein
MRVCLELARQPDRFVTDKINELAHYSLSPTAPDPKLVARKILGFVSSRRFIFIEELRERKRWSWLCVKQSCASAGIGLKIPRQNRLKTFQAPLQRQEKDLVAFEILKAK